METYGYLGLFVASFGAATLLPLSSEGVLYALVGADGFDDTLLWLAATGGNVGGALVNYALGAWTIHFAGRRWFPFSPDRIERAGARYERYGVWSLLLAWAPVVGDPLTFVAGLFGTNLLLFTALVTVGKGGRYAAVIWLAS
jgi:membrane protein YqaA with SNARE-associated domain